MKRQSPLGGDCIGSLPREMPHCRLAAQFPVTLAQCEEALLDCGELGSADLQFLAFERWYVGVETPAFLLGVRVELEAALEGSVLPAVHAAERLEGVGQLLLELFALDVVSDSFLAGQLAYATGRFHVDALGAEAG